MFLQTGKGNGDIIFIRNAVRGFHSVIEEIFRFTYFIYFNKVFKIADFLPIGSKSIFFGIKLFDGIFMNEFQCHDLSPEVLNQPYTAELSSAAKQEKGEIFKLRFYFSISSCGHPI